MTACMSGAARILKYNWPAFALTWGLAAVVLMAWPIGFGRLGAVAWVITALAGVAAAWAAVSLLVSHWIYDRSPLASGAWLTALLPAAGTPLEWVVIDAGLDAEVALDAVIPGSCTARLDIYDGVVVRAASVQRARSLTPRTHRATGAVASSLPLGDQSCDLIAVVFTAHEIRDAGIRELFFREVKRALRPAGRMLLVEHLRDIPNALAFGPGVFHFQPRAEWMRLAQSSGLRVANESRVTPWVTAIALERIA